jgi:hypothetical protein
MPPISYFNPATNPDSDLINIALLNGNQSFKIHITGSTIGGATDQSILTTQYNGVTLPVDGTVFGSGVIASHFVGGPIDTLSPFRPPILDVGYMNNASYYDVTIESVFPSGIVPFRVIRTTARTCCNLLNPGVAEYDECQQWIAVPSATLITSVGLKLQTVRGALVFDHTQSQAAKIENGY